MKSVILALSLVLAANVFADTSLDPVQGGANSNISSLKSMNKRKNYCMTKSMPPSDAPPVNQLSAVTISVEKGKNIEGIPLSVGESTCTRSTDCTQQVKMMRTRRDPDGAPEIYISTETIITKQDGLMGDIKTYVSDGKGGQLKVSDISRQSSNHFFGAAGTWSACQVADLMKSNDQLKTLLGGQNIKQPLVTNLDDPNLSPDALANGKAPLEIPSKGAPTNIKQPLVTPIPAGHYPLHSDDDDSDGEK